MHDSVLLGAAVMSRDLFLHLLPPSDSRTKAFRCHTLCSSQELIKFVWFLCTLSFLWFQFQFSCIYFPNRHLECTSKTFTIQDKNYRESTNITFIHLSSIKTTFLLISHCFLPSCTWKRDYGVFLWYLSKSKVARCFLFYFHLKHELLSEFESKNA